MISLKLISNFSKYSPLVYKNINGNFLKPTSLCLMTKLSVHREVNERLQAKLRNEDNITDSYQLIYRAPLKTYIKVTYFTAFTSLAVALPLIATSLYVNDFSQFPAMVGDKVIISSLNELYGIICGLAFVTVNIGAVISQYPFRIYKDTKSDKYIAVFQGILPWSNKNVEFLAGELYKYDKSIMPWKESMYAFRNRKVVIINDHLRRPNDLDGMMKKDK